MGLLDRFTNLDEDQGQGLLAGGLGMVAASGPSRTPVNFGQIALEGLNGYQSAVQNARKRKLMEQEAKQMQELTGLKLQDARSDLANQDAMRQRQAGLQEVYGRLSQGQQSPQQPDMSRMMGPTNENAAALQAQLPSPAAANDIFSQKMARAQQIRAAGYHPEADAEEEKALKFREEYSLTLQNLKGPDGQLRPYQVGKFGGVRDTGLGIAPKMTEMKLGDRSQWIDENTVAPGQQYQYGQSQESRASERSAAAGRAQSASQFNQRLNFDQQQPRGQIIQTDQGPMLADPRAGTARPVVGSDGQAIGPKMRAVPNQIQKAYVENASSLRKVQAALDAVKAYPDGLGVSNYLGDTIRQRTDPEGVDVRALVADIGSQKIHDRSGAAVTAAETPRLKPFIPSATDSPDTVEKKLEMFKREYSAMQSEIEGLYNEDMGYRPLGSAENKPAAPAATRKYNPKTGKIE